MVHSLYVQQTVIVKFFQQYDDICPEEDECYATEEAVLKNNKSTTNNHESQISMTSLESVFKVIKEHRTN